MENDIFSGFVFFFFSNEIAHDDPVLYLAFDCSKGTHPKCRIERCVLLSDPIVDSRFHREFSHNVTAATLKSQNNETAAMLVSQNNPLGVELFSYANPFSCSNKFA